jgi:enamine deaminase RidA (YjgF/YER057c/UK114 family)
LIPDRRSAWGEKMNIDQRLAQLGIDLPQAAAPVAAYVPSVQEGNLLHISGQISFAEDGSLIKGRLGENMQLAAGQQAARRCGIMLLAQIRTALGSLDRVDRIVKLGVFVNSAPSFTDQPKVANGASELMQEVFGEAGRHARSAVGVAVLPLGVAVEVDAIVAVKP